MQVSIESLGGLQRRMTVQVPAAEIDKQVEARLRRVGKTAKLKGFRPGKIPFKVIRQRYGGEVRQDVLSDLLRSSYAEAVTQEKLQPAGNPRIEAADAPQGEDFQYTATFEIYPDVELKKVDGLKIERPVAEIGDEDVDRVLLNLREQRGHWHAVERAAAEGDQVNIDFSGSIGGEPFEGGAGAGVDVLLGGGQMLPEFEKALPGTSAGQTLQAPVKFPKDYPSPEVAGKKAVFEIVVNTVSERHLPEVDDAFCRSFGIEEGGVAELKDGIRDNMRREMNEKVNSLLRDQILDALVEKNPVELPQALVDAEADQLRGEAARQMGIDDPDKLPPPEPFLDAARRRVARGLLVGRIVEQENIEADRAAVDERLEQLTGQLDDAAGVVSLYRSDQRLMRQLEMTVIEQKAINWLIEKAKIKDRKQSFRELMQLDNS